MTRLSHIHPSPAMIADELAWKFAGEFVGPGCRDLLSCVQRAQLGRSANRQLEQRLEVARRVTWFSPKCSQELFSLLDLLNGFKLQGNELAFVAAILSATAREVSYCRDDQWKLHRLSAKERRTFLRSPYRSHEAIDAESGSQDQHVQLVQTSVAGSHPGLFDPLGHFDLPAPVLEGAAGDLLAALNP